MTQELRIFGDGPLVLCLSGGGFRAMFFHLGVVRALFELKCLHRVTHVFSVSGGSIIAAHMGLNWTAYSGQRPSEFQDLSDALVRFARNDLRGRIVRRWLLFHARSRELQNSYDAFFNHARLVELPVTPRFHFFSTSMKTGRLCAFTRDHFVVAAEGGGLIEYPAEAQPIAQAVAASSAFPPLFPPVELDLPDLPRAMFQPDTLTDGGVFDNLGISRLDEFLAEHNPPDHPHIIVSDASALFDDAPDTRFKWLPSRAARATDILMQRVASLESGRWKKPPDELTVLKITDTVEDLPFGSMRFRPQSLKAQRLLKSVRTDFDAFPIPLIRALVQHGHEVAFQAAVVSAVGMPIKQYRATVPPQNGPKEDTVPWDPMPPGWPDREAMKAHAQTAAIRKPLEDLQATLASASRVFGGQPSPDVQHAREEEALRRRRATEQVEALLLTSSNRPLALWNRRDWAAWLLAAIGVTLLSGLGVIGWRAVHLLTNRAAGIEPTGVLRIVECVPYAGEGWVKRIPSLEPLLGENGYVYTLRTAPLGDLTSNRPHAAAVGTIALVNLDNARDFLFLDQNPGDATQLMLLEQASPMRLLLPEGHPGDRLRGILINPTAIPLATCLNNFIISLEGNP